MGTGKTLIPSGSVSDGNSGNNYTVNFANNTNGTITALSLTVSATGVNKVYDGTAAATVTLSLSNNVVSGDDVTANYASASFANKNVGTGKAVSVSGITLSGDDAGNYTSNTTASTSANITAAADDVTASSDNKTYDGTTSSSGTPTVTTGSLATGDTGSFSQTFDTKNVGTGKTLTPSGSVSDGNSRRQLHRDLRQQHTTGTITALSLTVSATGVNKVYDGTAAATTVTLSLLEERGQR